MGNNQTLEVRNIKICFIAAWTLAVVASALITSCSRAANQEARRKELLESFQNYDKRVVAQRGWSHAKLSFLIPNFGQSSNPAPLHAGGHQLKALGPFRLGMTIDQVRHEASSANLVGESTWQSAWCVAPKKGSENTGIVIGAPTAEYSKRAGGSNKFDIYNLNFRPVGSTLRLKSVGFFRNNRSSQTVELDDRYLDALTEKADTSTSQLCDVTNTEVLLIMGNERFKNDVLYAVLPNPIFAKIRLPKKVRGALSRWEKSTDVEGIADCCDVYSKKANFNGAWHLKSTYAINYLIGNSGDAPSSFPYLIVIDEAGKLIWNGRPADFKSGGFKAQRSNIEFARSMPS